MLLIFFFTFDFVHRWKTNYLPHFNITVNTTVAVSCSDGHGHTQVNTTGNLFLAQVQLMAESQYSTYLSLFLYLWALLFYAACGWHTIRRYLVDSQGAVCRKGSTLRLWRVMNMYFWCSTWTITFHTDPRLQAIFCKFLFKWMEKYICKQFWLKLNKLQWCHWTETCVLIKSVLTC